MSDDPVALVAALVAVLATVLGMAWYLATRIQRLETMIEALAKGADERAREAREHLDSLQAVRERLVVEEATVKRLDVEIQSLRDLRHDLANAMTAWNLRER